MAHILRFAVTAAAVTLGQLACSSPSTEAVGADRGELLPGGAELGGSGGGPGNPSGGNPSGGDPSGGTGGTAGGSTLNPSGGAAGGNSSNSGGAGGGGASGFAGNAGTPAAIISGLPPVGEGGVPRPSGTAGNFEVLDWAGFQAAVSYTFDDSNSSQIQNYAALQALGVPLTFYLQTGKVTESSNPIWGQAVLDGHELGNHTQSHLSTGATIGDDTDAATAFIEDNFGVTVYTMAAPNGSAAYADIARTRFLINRGVNDQQIAPNGTTDPYNLSCYIPATNTLEATFNAKVDAVRSAGNWQVMLVHGFTGGSDGAYQPVALDEFVAGVEYAKGLEDVWIDTLVDVAAYWTAQKLLTAVTPTTAGGVTTWTWTLPDHFPPAQFLRVTVDGGTLTQGGAELSWDDHGYYEVSLDVGSVTLSP